MKKLLIALVISLSACAQLGIAPADTFNKKVAAAYETVAAVDDTAIALVKAGKLSKAEAQTVKTSTDGAIAGIAAASTMTDPTAAQNRLAVVTASLVALQTFLATHQGK